MSSHKISSDNVSTAIGTTSNITVSVDTAIVVSDSCEFHTIIKPNKLTSI
jgi:hypothetical protein